jgi:hypothetical protein
MMNPAMGSILDNMGERRTFEGTIGDEGGVMLLGNNDLAKELGQFTGKRVRITVEEVDLGDRRSGSQHPGGEGKPNFADMIKRMEGMQPSKPLVLSRNELFQTFAEYPSVDSRFEQRGFSVVLGYPVRKLRVSQASNGELRVSYWRLDGRIRVLVLRKGDHNEVTFP